MKTLLLLAILLVSVSFAAAQNHEYAPLQEKEISYKNWNYKSVRDGKEINLRDFAKNKKLVMVVYFAPWCPNWKLEAPVAQKFYEKYKANGLEIVGVGEYDTIDSIKTSLDTFKITFPVVYELELKETKERADVRQKTLHYEYRQKTGDTRNWGSPWNIFLIPSQLKSKGDTLTEKTFVVNGELIEADTEAFIREKLGLPKEEKTVSTKEKASTEVCEDSATATSLKKP
ncbi:MAG TPA: TlpA disulfide reductase family protein [Pyrinomonadaceae bacterium]|jgi:thiol-disulfide isomerase/thioredoxin